MHAGIQTLDRSREPKSGKPNRFLFLLHTDQETESEAQAMDHSEIETTHSGTHSLTHSTNEKGAHPNQCSTIPIDSLNLRRCNENKVCTLELLLICLLIPNCERLWDRWHAVPRK